MNKYKLIYGSLGLLSALGILGIYTENKLFLCFFAFLIHFKYLFVDIDEMLEDYTNKSAAFSFFAGNFVFTIISLYRFFVLNHDLYESSIFALLFSWSISIFVYTILIIIYEFKEKIGMRND